ncbi:hypothetical protein BD410DRAFT_694951, partial [Rickenella mellea]
AGYTSDSLCSKILMSPGDYSAFSRSDGVLFCKNLHGDSVIVIPRTLLGGRSLTEIVIDSGHTVLGHLGCNKTVEYIRRWYWW